ncbi:ABC transporter permease, partial [Yersinia sp. 2544 StPb PI]|uniref:ABC transporter permease n=1 Tax=Yersinia sp. 2544 StPb PI TaxID=3117409 RepID=UPI003B27DB3F
IVFAHNFIIIFIVITFVSPGWSWMALWAILGFIILTVSLFSMSIILAILCTRFRDLQMIVQNVLLVSFYFTPIMWKTHQLSDKLNYIINFNPLVHFFNIIRDPMLGVAPNFNSMLISICVTIVIFFVSMVFMRKYCARIAYWL